METLSVHCFESYFNGNMQAAIVSSQTLEEVARLEQVSLIWIKLIIFVQLLGQY